MDFRLASVTSDRVSGYRCDTTRQPTFLPTPSKTALHPVSCLLQAWLAVEDLHCLQAPSRHRYCVTVGYLVWVNIRSLKGTAECALSLEKQWPDP
jgi:hypothetical protein